MVLRGQKLASLTACLAGQLLVGGAPMPLPALPLQGAGRACLITATGSDPITVVQASPGSATTPIERTGRYLPMADCSGVRIVRGVALVYFGKGESERRPQTVRAGEPVQVPDDVGPSTDDWTGFLDAFNRLGARRQSVRATSRGIQDDAARLFPTGRILPPTMAITIDVTPLEIAEIDRFFITLEAGTRETVLAQDHIVGTLRIPADALTRGLNYQWTAVIRGAPLEGAFYVLTRSEAAAIEAADPSHRGTGAASALDRAIYLHSRGLEFDSLHIIRQLLADQR
jgi:hypothetical protein